MHHSVAGKAAYRQTKVARLVRQRFAPDGCARIHDLLHCFERGLPLVIHMRYLLGSDERGRVEFRIF
jgi:hypothetical protein